MQGENFVCRRIFLKKTSVVTQISEGIEGAGVGVKEVLGQGAGCAVLIGLFDLVGMAIRHMPMRHIAIGFGFLCAWLASFLHHAAQRNPQLHLIRQHHVWPYLSVASIAFPAAQRCSFAVHLAS